MLSSRLQNFIVKGGLQEPFRKIYHLYEDLVEHGAVKRNKIFKASFNGQRCFILCTGASLRDLDLLKLKNEYTFVCNDLYKHYAFDQLNPDFYAIIDPIRAFPTRSEATQYFRPIGEKVINPEIKFFFCASNRIFIENLKVFNKKKIFYVKSLLPMTSAATQKNDLSERITFMDGVLYFMISAAIYMGFKEIYLCGCGYTYQPILHQHFYDSPCYSKEISREELNSKITDFIHKSATRGLKVNTILEDEVSYRPLYILETPCNPRHEIMAIFAEENGARIYNIVPEGFNSPIYDAVSWDFVVRNILEIL